MREGRSEGGEEGRRERRKTINKSKVFGFASQPSTVLLESEPVVSFDSSFFLYPLYQIHARKSQPISGHEMNNSS